MICETYLYSKHQYGIVLLQSRFLFLISVCYLVNINDDEYVVKHGQPWFPLWLYVERPCRNLEMVVLYIWLCLGSSDSNLLMV